MKDGRIPERWKDKPAKLRQKDRDASWSGKYTSAKVTDSSSQRRSSRYISPSRMFGYKTR
jgi:hypothetical protein